MSQIEVADHNVAEDARNSSVYVPPLQRTEGQPPPIAAQMGRHIGKFLMGMRRGG